MTEEERPRAHEWKMREFDAIITNLNAHARKLPKTTEWREGAIVFGATLALIAVVKLFL